MSLGNLERADHQEKVQILLQVLTPTNTFLLKYQKNVCLKRNKESFVFYVMH
jgi:hypothetical protein